MCDSAGKVPAKVWVNMATSLFTDTKSGLQPPHPDVSWSLSFFPPLVNYVVLNVSLP